MKKFVKYSNTKTYMFPNGDIATPEKIKENFPAVDVFTHVIETDEAGQVCFAVMNLAALKSQLGIPAATPEAESITMIEEIMNTPQPEPEPSPEERIAAALEFQNLLSI